MEVLVQSLPYLARGALETLVLAGVSILGSTLLGTALGIAAMAAGPVLRIAIAVYVFLIRGIPVLILLFLFYFWLPSVGIHTSDKVAVLTALVGYGAALVTEAVRGALVAVPTEQTLAAQGLGMRKAQILRNVVIPQALRSSIPPMLNIWIHLIKCTSYVSIVGVWELTFASTEVTQRTLAPFTILGAVMLFYYAMCFPIAVAARHLESRIGGARGAIV